MKGLKEVKRFFYTAIKKNEEFEGIVHADSIDSAREQLVLKGYEEIILSVLSSLPDDLAGQELTDNGSLPPLST